MQSFEYGLILSLTRMPVETNRKQTVNLLIFHFVHFCPFSFLTSIFFFLIFLLDINLRHLVTIINDHKLNLKYTYDVQIHSPVFQFDS